MDDLKSVLLSRQQQLPTIPPNKTPRVPPRWKRWETAEKMKDAYQNNWSPNPILLRILEGDR